MLFLLTTFLACTPKTTPDVVGGVVGGTVAPTTELPAPVPAGVSQQLTMANNGQTVTVAVGSRFAVQLVGTPTAGYQWEVTKTPDFLTKAEVTGGDTVPEQSQPGYTGGNHWEVFSFQAQQAGEGMLRLEQRRPWEPKTEPAAQTFSVVIKAQ